MVIYDIKMPKCTLVKRIKINPIFCESFNFGDFLCYIWNLATMIFFSHIFKNLLLYTKKLYLQTKNHHNSFKIECFMGQMHLQHSFCTSPYRHFRNNPISHKVKISKRQKRLLF